MPDKRTILLIEDDAVDAKAVERLLYPRDTGAPNGGLFELSHAVSLADGLAKLAERTFDLVLLDLGLPDSERTESVAEIHQQSPDLPIVVLTGANDDTIGLNAVRQGAQDYLVKGQVDSNLLVRALRYAIERQRLLKELEQAQQREQHERELRLLGWGD